MERYSTMVFEEIISKSWSKSCSVRCFLLKESTSINRINCIFRLQCFKSAWLYAFLHDGLKFPVNYQRLRSASLVNNNDVQWTLGAILYKTRFLPLRLIKSFTFLFLIIFQNLFSRAINQVKSTIHYKRTNTDSTVMIIIIFIMLILCVLLFYRQILRATMRSLFYRRSGLHSSSSSSNFNQRYQLLTAVIVDDSPRIYSNGKTSQSSSALFNGRLRNIWRIYLSTCFFLLVFVKSFFFASLSYPRL